MAFLEINPRYRSLLEGLGLARPEQVLALPAVIVSGHPDRNVARVTLGAVPAFLKREHRIRWRERLQNLCAGFGLVSKSQREAHTLQKLQEAGIGCPDWIAVGEDHEGRAFLLLEELAGAVDLRRYVGEHPAPSVHQRRRLARQLGQALARMHAAGFAHRDLYAKHVLVDPHDERLYFLDWQRSGQRRRLSWKQRCRDLAALDATLPDELAAPRDRFACLRAYAEEVRRAEAGLTGWCERLIVDLCRLGFTLRCLAGRIRHEARQLLQKRHVRETRTCPPLADEGVIWLDGEAVCVTQSFLRELKGTMPEWLRPSSGRGTTRTIVPLPNDRRGLLIRRTLDQPLAWLVRALRRRVVRSPELKQAGRLFRCLRQGLPAPRLLAFGQRQTWPWRTESFLLTELEPEPMGRAG